MYITTHEKDGSLAIRDIPRRGRIVKRFSLKGVVDVKKANGKVFFLTDKGHVKCYSIIPSNWETITTNVKNATHIDVSGSLLSISFPKRKPILKKLT